MYIESSREIHLVSRPDGMPADDDFRLVSRSVPVLGEGEVLVKNLWLSVDPYMRGRMIERASYVAPFALNEVLSGGAVVLTRMPVLLARTEWLSKSGQRLSSFHK